jgi:hypothetical protein
MTLYTYNINLINILEKFAGNESHHMIQYFILGS